MLFRRDWCLPPSQYTAQSVGYPIRRELHARVRRYRSPRPRRGRNRPRAALGLTMAAAGQLGRHGGRYGARCAPAPAELPSLWWRFVGNVMALARDAQRALPKASAVPSDIAEFSASPGGHKRCRLLGGADRRDPIHGQPGGVMRCGGALAGRQRYKFPLLLPNRGCGRPSSSGPPAGPVRI